MTRKTFVNLLLEAVCSYGGIAHKSGMKGADKFVGSKAGLFFGVNPDGTNETDHYILLELGDGTFWRVLPERVLKLDDHEQEMWDKFRKFKENEADSDDSTEF